MAYENSGRLFRNDRKERDNHPDYTGDFTDENGKKWRCAAWLKDGKGGKWLSFKISEDTREQYKDAAQPVAPKDEPQGGSDLDDEIPF